MNVKNSVSDNMVALIFFIIPTLMIIGGYFVYKIPYPLSPSNLLLAQILMFISLFLLIIGFLWREKNNGHRLRIAGWLAFAFFWSAMPYYLYASEGEDIFNAVVCILGVYVLVYLAYHEWLSLKRNENVSCLKWIAGASSLAGIVYWGMEFTFIGSWFLRVVAEQSAGTLNSIMGDTFLFISQGDHNIIYHSQYVVTIIFACTALQAMVIFIGMITALPKVEIKRKIIGLLITLVPIYILNLLRNAMVGWLIGEDIADFYLAHNVISKVGALATLIILLFVLIKIIPEIFDEIICLTELPKRNGPLENMFKKIIGRSK